MYNRELKIKNSSEINDMQNTSNEPRNIFPNLLKKYKDLNTRFS